MEKNFRTLTKITLVLVYLVIVAGATVRMTGSGMGCPDWPKCFGYYIPPTAEDQLLWKAEKNYKKGQVIIVDEALYVAKDDMKTGKQYLPDNWTPYTKHDYAVFNPYHTWVEFINRLIGALAGLSTLFMAIASIRFWSIKRGITLLSWLTLFGMGFQAWLGATVVYSVLAPIKVSLHMIMALAIVAVLLYILHLSRKKTTLFIRFPLFNTILIIAFIFTIVQIVLGTQVRQFIDEQVKNMGAHAQTLWLKDPALSFYIHRSFSIIVFLVNVLLFFYNRTKNLGYYRMQPIMILLLMEILTGILMNYVNFPLGSQAAHLIIASALFGFQFYLILDTKRSHSP